jgi:hypothetical protein
MSLARASLFAEPLYINERPWPSISSGPQVAGPVVALYRALFGGLAAGLFGLSGAVSAAPSGLAAGKLATEAPSEFCRRGVTHAND